tara:strand:- start:1094 stop:1486 length:393 start_codon:yes stop_codon:yes gene_type:complete
MKSDFTIEGNVGDAFIKISKEGEVELIFGEDDISITREVVDISEQNVYKAATQFSLMIDSYLRNEVALDDLILNSTTGSIPSELIGKDILPITLAGAGFEDFEVEEKKIPMGLEKDNVIQFKQRKKDEDK